MKNKKYFIELSNFYNEKRNLFLYLIVVIACLCGGLSGNLKFSFCLNYYTSITQWISLSLLSLTFGLNIYSLIYKTNNSYEIILRFKSYKEVIKDQSKKIIFSTIYFLIIYYLLSIIIPLFIATSNIGLEGLTMLSSLNEYLYLAFIMLRMSIIFLIVNVMLGFLLTFSNKKIYYFAILLNSIMFFLVGVSVEVTHFYNAPLMYYNYLLGIPFNSYILEVVSSVLQVNLLLLIAIGCYKFTLRKKRDV